MVGRGAGSVAEDVSAARPVPGAGPTAGEVGEHELIARIAERMGGPPRGEMWAGDDAALVRAPGDPILFTVDTLVEAIDFDLAYCTGADVGWKAIAVNASDIAAMGGAPTHAVASLSLRRDTPVTLVDDVVEGISAAAARWGIGVVGGDLSEARDLSLSVAMLGAPGPGGGVPRGGARAGDAVCVTGSLGGAAGGLHALRRGLRDETREMGDVSDALRALADRHLRPRARVSEGGLLARVASSMIDVSDGLAVDLGHLLAASGVGCALEADAVPIDGALLRVARALPEESLDPLALAITGGEDFELLFTVEAEAVHDARAALAALGTEVTRLGAITRSGRRIGDRDIEEWKEKGWEHLRNR